MSRTPDPHAREPWEILADVHLRSADYARPPDGPAPFREPLVHVGLTPTWDAKIVRYDPRRGPCPACNDVPLKPHEVCLVCHATAAEAVRWPMQATLGLRRRVRRRRAQSGTRTKNHALPQAPKAA